MRQPSSISKVLLVDDDQELTSLLSQYLTSEGFAVHTVGDGDVGAQEALKGGYSLVVLDIMMPRVSGIEALRRIRAQSQVPVLMLTARGDNVDRIVGLDLGADDYVPKPCTPGELVARIRAILRRTAGQAGVARLPGTESLQAGALSISPASRKASWFGTPLDITGIEFNLLEVLARHAGALITKERISQEAFGKPLAPFDRRIDVHISSIRQKLGTRPDGSSWIQSVRGLGYQLISE